jgi:fluoroacetyl-CoA thioesterase
LTFEDLKPGLRGSLTMTVGDRHSVVAMSGQFGVEADMPPVFATANMIAFVEWTCVSAIAPYLAPHQRTVGTHVDMSHLAATPIGMQVTAEVELVEVEGRRLRFKAVCRDEAEVIGEGFHERAVIDHDRFLRRLARKQGGG